MSGLCEEELPVLPPLAVERFVKPAASLRILLLVSGGIDNRGEAPVGLLGSATVCRSVAAQLPAVSLSFAGAERKTNWSLI